MFAGGEPLFRYCDCPVSEDCLRLSKLFCMFDCSGALIGRRSVCLHRYEEDIEKTKQLGSNCFRFSFEWAQIEPRRGKLDESVIKK